MKTSHQFRGKKAGGFTLIEMIVSVAIALIVISLSFPVFQAARSMAMQAGCLSNLKQIGTALGMYANDNNGQLPGPQWERVYVTNVLPVSLEPYTTAGTNVLQKERLWTCPANNGIKKVQNTQSPKVTSYRSHHPIFGYPSPAESPLAASTMMSIRANYAGNQQWLLQDIDFWNYPSTTAVGGEQPPPHGGKRNTLFLDARVELIKAEKNKSP